MSRIHSLRHWVKRRESPAARVVYRMAMESRHFAVPVVPVLHHALYALYVGTRHAFSEFMRIFWYTPLFQSRLSRPARRLQLYGGLPYLTGPLDIEIGERTRISAATTFSGRSAAGQRPTLSIGHNVDIGWQTTIAVGTTVLIGNNVRIAGRAFLAGYPGHPIDAAARAAGEPDTQDQVGHIILDDDVWLATGVTVLAGVRIGRGTIVAAGSVVTKDLPANVLAGGVPARTIRPLSKSPLSAHARSAA